MAVNKEIFITEEMRTELETHIKHYLHWEEGENVHIFILCGYVGERRDRCAFLKNLTLYSLFIIANTIMCVSIIGIILTTYLLSIYSRLIWIGLFILLAYVPITKFLVAFKQHELYRVSFSSLEKNFEYANNISDIMRVETVLSIWKPWESIKSILKMVILFRTNHTKQSFELLSLANDFISNLNSISTNPKMELLGCYVVEKNQYVKITN